MLQQKFTVQVTTLPDCGDVIRFDGIPLSQSSCVSPVKLSVGRAGGAKSNNGEKAWSSINH